MPATQSPGISQATIDELLNDDLITFSAARRSFPRGARPDLSTLHRYRTRGAGGIRLAAIRIGDRWFTSERAIRRFIVDRTRAGSGK